MSTHRLRVVADRRSALLTHPSDSVNPDTFSDGGSGHQNQVMRWKSLVLYRILYGNRVMKVQRRNNLVVGSVGS